MANNITTTPTPAPGVSIKTFDGTLNPDAANPADRVFQTLVNARDLHAALGSGAKFADWIRDRIEQHELVEEEDFAQRSFSENGEKPQGRPSTDYHLTLDTAKHLALADRSPQGRAVRQYFIEVERRAHEHVVPLISELRAQNQQISEQNALLRQQVQKTYLRDNPKAAKVLRYHAIQELTQAEKARLMGWKTSDNWRKMLGEMAALGLVDYTPDPGRQAGGVAAIAHMKALHQAYGKPAVSPKQLAARQQNVRRAHEKNKGRKGRSPAQVESSNANLTRAQEAQARKKAGLTESQTMAV